MAPDLQADEDSSFAARLKFRDAARRAAKDKGVRICCFSCEDEKNPQNVMKWLYIIKWCIQNICNYLRSTLDICVLYKFYFSH